MASMIYFLFTGSIISYFPFSPLDAPRFVPFTIMLTPARALLASESFTIPDIFIFAADSNELKQNITIINTLNDTFLYLLLKIIISFFQDQYCNV